MQVEAILDTWRAWDAPLRVRPGLVGPLGGGRSNRSFLLDSGGVQMALRINAKDDLLPNRRGGEVKTWQAASAAGIAPPLLYADPDGTFLVSAYIETRLPVRPQDDPVIAEQALELLQRCHRLDVTAPGIDYARHIERYWRIIEARHLPDESKLRKQREAMEFVLENLIDSNTPRGLCHHDPVQENFVGSPEKLYLIDWEYAARGLLVMDYAALQLEWGFSVEKIVAHTGVDMKLLSMARDFYRYECGLWSMITQSHHRHTTVHLS